MPGEIKIIGGKFKGKKIKVLDMPNLRPTPNRLRETLFNVIQFDIKQAECLDAFAGTGALGLEAYSRGAKQITFLESHPQIYKKLQENLHFFSDSLECLCIDTLNFLKTTKKTFDIIFLDPPFHKDLWIPCIECIENRQLIHENGLLYIEAPQWISPLTQNWVLIKQDRIGDVFYSIYKKINAV
jgi:16S rRNA (guanine966-N2)-methyltransferase